jgi:hypothetical protein
VILVALSFRCFAIWVLALPLLFSFVKHSRPFTWLFRWDFRYINTSRTCFAGSVMALVVALPILDPQKQYVHEDVSHHTISPGIFGATGIMAVRLFFSFILFLVSEYLQVSLFPSSRSCAEG